MSTTLTNMSHRLQAFRTRYLEPSARFLDVRARLMERNAPAILHITHYKAGSQWIHKILHQACPRCIVEPRGQFESLKRGAVLSGKIYPTLYITREQLQEFSLPRHTRVFIVIRDLRDTLVSLYFSVKVSHVSTKFIEPNRLRLRSLNQEDGLLDVLANNLPRSAEIQRSWLGAPDPMVHYEDLLKDDETVLDQILRGHCGLPTYRSRLRRIVRDCRFENLTGGRVRGDENIHAHERKGIAGDWRNHFTDRVKDAFKQKYGDLLIATGYEKDLNW